MPLYEYQCQDCRQRIEVIQKFSDDPLTECSHCGGRLERLLSAPAIQFKGSGWYVTDYAPGKNGAGPEKESTESDSKAAAPADSTEKSAKTDKTAKESTPVSTPAKGKPQAGSSSD